MNFSNYIKSTVIISLGIYSLNASAAFVEIEHFEFDDSAGTNLGLSTNTGTNGTAFTFGGPPTVVQDGAGNLDVDILHTGQTFRKLTPYASPYNTGTFSIDITLNSWDLTNNAVGGAMTWQLVSAVGGANLAAIRLEKDDTEGTRVRLFTDLGGTTQGFRNFDYGLVNNTAVTFSLEFDFDNDTATYFKDGSQTHAFTDFEGSQIAQVQWNTNNPWTDSTVSIGEMSVSGPSVIPVPAAAWLFGSALVGLGIIRRKG